MAHPFDPEILLSRPLMAILSSVDHTGAPRTAPVWFLWEDRVLWMLGSRSASTTRRLSADPRCSVEITQFDVRAGVLLHLGLRGRADVRPNEPALFRRLLARYLGAEDGWNPWFIETVARIDDPAGRLIRLAPDSVFTNDVSYFRTGPERAVSV